MKPKNYVILMIVCIVAMVLTVSSPCRAAWQYLGSYVPNNPTYGRNTDWSTYFEEFSFSSGTTAGSGGVNASGTCNAKTWVRTSVSASGPTDMWRSASASCSTWGNSYYGNIPYEPSLLSVSWSVSGSGSVECSGSVDDTRGNASVYASSSASGDTSADDGSGDGSASGSASTAYELGSADVSWGGYAEEDSSSVDVGYGSYSASLSFSVSGSGGWDDYYSTQFTASASVYAGSSSYASASVTQGTAYAGSDSEGHCSGSSSVSVSY